MDAKAKRDLKLTPGGAWEPVEVLDGMDAAGVSDIRQWLGSQGWDDFLAVGSQEGGTLYIATWRRQLDDEPTQYLLEIGDCNSFSHFLMTESIIDLMDLVSRWSPAVQAAAVAEVLSELSRPDLSARGLVETIAGRAAVGSTETAQELLRQRKLDRDARERVRRSRSDSQSR